MKVFLTFFVSLLLIITQTSCSEGDSTDVKEGNANRESFIKASWNGDDVDFKSLRCGKIPGGENYRISSFTDNDGHMVIMNWHRDEQDRTNYHFNKAPSVSLDVKDGEGNTATYRHTTVEVSEVDYNEEQIKYIKGKANLRPTNEAARNANPEGGVLNFEAQCR
ncbi:MAG: hypothetical protein ACK4ND_15350 [Cytophagaceae bacterium]